MTDNLYRVPATQNHPCNARYTRLTISNFTLVSSGLYGLSYDCLGPSKSNQSSSEISPFRPVSAYFTHCQTKRLSLASLRSTPAPLSFGIFPVSRPFDVFPGPDAPGLRTAFNTHFNTELKVLNRQSAWGSCYFPPWGSIKALS